MVLTGGASTGNRPLALWVVPVPEMGGVARHVLDAATHGLPGWQLVVLCPDGVLARRLRAVGAHVVTGDFGPGAGFLRSLRTIKRQLEWLRPEAVHSHLAYADVVSAVAVLGTKVRLVTTEHGIAGEDSIYHGSAFRSKLKALMHWTRLLRADAIIAVSEATKEAMLRKWHPRQNILVIPNGVNGDETWRRVNEIRSVMGHSSGLRILSLSRLAPEKGLATLLRAFALVLERCPGARLVIAGEGPERQSLESLAAELGVRGEVDFPGFVEPIAAMAGADLLVQLSIWENCSYTLLDAVSAGIGVLATDVGGNAEIVSQRSLVGRMDPQAVANSVLEYLGPPKHVAQDHPRVPSVRSMMEKTASVYAELRR